MLGEKFFSNKVSLKPSLTFYVINFVTMELLFLDFSKYLFLVLDI